MALVLDPESLRVDVGSEMGEPNHVFPRVLFSLLCEVEGVTHDGTRVPVEFDVVHLVDEDLGVKRVAVNASNFDRLLTDSDQPRMADLVALVRSWIVAGGIPNGTGTETMKSYGGTRADLAWAEHRQRYMAMSTIVGSGRGRPVTRSPAYLRQLAEDYIRAWVDNPRDYMNALIAERSTGPDAKGRNGIKADIRLAKKEGWLAPATVRGSKEGPRPGWRLLVVWQNEGRWPIREKSE